MALLFFSDVDDPQEWCQALLPHIPDLDLRAWPDVGNPDEIQTCLVWKPPPGLLKDFKNLKVILSLAAGVDALLEDKTLPDLPICRMVDPGLASGMAEFVLTTSLFIHRDLHRFQRFQRERHWNFIPPRAAEGCRIGVLGLGEMGRKSAALLCQHGFHVSGWSRSPKSLEGVECFHGPDGLTAMAAQSDILVCLLPLTAETMGLLNAKLFDAMPRGSSLIQAGRGPQLDEQDLSAALESGQLDYAVLDVFAQEPLPSDHEFWGNAKIMITPHAAAYSTPKTGALSVAANLKRLAAGEPLIHVVDRHRGY